MIMSDCNDLDYHNNCSKDDGIIDNSIHIKFIMIMIMSNSNDINYYNSHKDDGIINKT